MRKAIRRCLALSFIFCIFSTAVPAQKRFYIGPDDHTDYFWLADDITYRQAFLTMIDYYLDKMDATQSNPSDRQMRWNCDGSLWMWEYEKNRSAAQFERMMSRLRDGHMSVNLNALALVQGGSPTEAVLRGMYYPGLIERRHNVKFPLAIAMENQTLPYGLPSLWAGSGAKYSWKGVCGCATAVADLNDRDREIYYAGGRDGSRVLMKWNSLFSGNTNIGGYAEAFDPLASIQFADSNPTFRSKYPFPVIGAFGRGHDDLQYLSDEFVDVAQQNTTPDRRIIVSDQVDFFRDFEAAYGPQLETYAAAYGNEWDVLTASMAEVTSRLRRAVEKLRTAEAMATLVSMNDPSFMTARAAQRDKAMLDMGLYFEHDWTADGPVSASARAAWSKRVEAEVTDYVEGLSMDAARRLGEQISRSGQYRRFAVFNPLSWQRSDVVEIPHRGNYKVRIVDVSTGAEVPSQPVRTGNSQTIRLLASNIPPVGYKVYEIREGAAGQFAGGPAGSGTTIENERYKLTLAGDGSITSLIDKTRSDREFARNIGGRVINDLGGDRSGNVVIENSGPVSITLRAISASPVAHTTRVTLYRDLDRIDIKNEITANFSDTKTWGFSFDLNSPDVWHEEVGAVIRAKLLSAGGHYSPKNARYDWLTMNHFADMTSGQSNVGITISNWDDSFMKLGSSTASSLDTSTPQINVLAGGRVDGPGLGIPNQNGDRYFMQRFALRTHGSFDQLSAMQFSLEHQNPLVPVMIDGLDTRTRPYPAESFSFVTISDPNVILWALKPAEDGIGRGVVARVWNQAAMPRWYTIELDRSIASAERLTHIETTIGPADVEYGQLSATAQQQQIQTHLLKFAAQLNRPPETSAK
ncbi:MAG: glycoside hydrolase [Acidobacteria bacterium]|nr:glycoside hydrolase [Acidobacteriota bacterium]